MFFCSDIAPELGSRWKGLSVGLAASLEGLHWPCAAASNHTPSASMESPVPHWSARSEGRNAANNQAEL